MLLVVLLQLVLAARAYPFALLGPLKNRANGAPDPWQGRPYAGKPAGLGYELTGDIGGPMFLGERYRWNVPVVTYGFDPSFLGYFGVRGVEAVEQAIATLNAIPPAGELSQDLTEYPLSSLRYNATADTRHVLDLESFSLSLLLEQMGLANPERFVWGLRNRTGSHVPVNESDYALINLNYDPITLEPSTIVNGSIYHYIILDNLGPRGGEWASAVEWAPLDPAPRPYSSVAGLAPSAELRFGTEYTMAPPGLRPGNYLTGLTRDDVGGLRFLLNSTNLAWELLPPDVHAHGSDPSDFVNAAVRPGVGKLTFRRIEYDVANGGFQLTTIRFADHYVTRHGRRRQMLERVIKRPDIVFQAVDLGGTLFPDPPVFVPRLYDRSGTTNWANYARLDPRLTTPAGGPGVILPPVTIAFSRLGRYVAASRGPSDYIPQWGSFEDPPTSLVVYAAPETNLSSLVIETRMVASNEVRYLQWCILGFPGEVYRTETSADLVHWTATDEHFFPLADGNVLTLLQPATDARRFFRVIKE
jgi:hypothetical protein